MQTVDDEYWHMLIDTVEGKFQKSKLERKLHATELQIKTLETSIEELESQVQKEFNDVEILKTNSLPKFWHQMRETLDEKIKREEDELLDIQMAYLTAVQTLESAKSESKYIQSMLEELADIDEILYDLAFEQEVSKTDELRFMANKVALWHTRLIHLNQAIPQGHSAEQDLHEAQKISLAISPPLTPSVSLDIGISTISIPLNKEDASDTELTSFNIAIDKVRISFTEFCEQLKSISIDAQDLHNVLTQYPDIFKEQFRPAFWTLTMPKPPPLNFLFNRISAPQIESIRRLILKKINMLEIEIKTELAKQSTLEKEWNACWTANNL